MRVRIDGSEIQTEAQFHAALRQAISPRLAMRREASMVRTPA